MGHPPPHGIQAEKATSMKSHTKGLSSVPLRATQGLPGWAAPGKSSVRPAGSNVGNLKEVLLLLWTKSGPPNWKFPMLDPWAQHHPEKCLFAPVCDSSPGTQDLSVQEVRVAFQSNPLPPAASPGRGLGLRTPSLLELPAVWPAGDCFWCLTEGHCSGLWLEESLLPDFYMNSSKLITVRPSCH
ncbi:hypothetical protein P7K49_035570 [Saguinus oedipus]|uniref:Uncharacterized protein n=1 Tax=Saguinus oedipus TaxID=9490 RepID=A0ABQ9TNL3_SAGOE|nr:hypothetical protein P7K49_035570 [Saguinus oedipus]